jgi:hypothetical protein
MEDEIKSNNKDPLDEIRLALSHIELADLFSRDYVGDDLVIALDDVIRFCIRFQKNLNHMMREQRQKEKKKMKKMKKKN